MEQLLEKIQGTPHVLFPKALCLNSLVDDAAAGELPKASAEQKAIC